MADDNQDQAEKTEEPTQRRLQEAQKKGQIASSREVTSFFILAALALYLAWIIPMIGKDSTSSLARYIQAPHDIPVDETSIKLFISETLADIALIMMLPILLVVLAILSASALQNGFLISAEPIMPKLEKISPLKGLKRMFSLKSVAEFVKGLIKIILVGTVAFIVVYPEIAGLDRVIGFDIMGIFIYLGSLALRIAIGAAAIMFIVAVLDFMYQKYEHIKGLRMSQREIKEELKQTEGDPMVRARLRQIRMERARQRMMAAVPEADVVITNPTHYSVALQYDEKTMPAPVVIAKGVDFMALRIREVAKEHKIPLVENKPLARSLYDSVDLDEEIPVEHYQAVAEVIGYVYRLKGKMAA